ncbi:LPS translocon maturation chaperone LptM [Methylomonas sp. MgM2]
MNPFVMSLNRIFFLIALVVFLQACGQTGPLYMPGSPAPIYVPEVQPDEE